MSSIVKEFLGINYLAFYFNNNLVRLCFVWDNMDAQAID